MCVNIMLIAPGMVLLQIANNSLFCYLKFLFLFKVLQRLFHVYFFSILYTYVSEILQWYSSCCLLPLLPLYTFNFQFTKIIMHAAVFSALVSTARLLAIPPTYYFHQFFFVAMDYTFYPSVSVSNESFT